MLFLTIDIYHKVKDVFGTNFTYVSLFKRFMTDVK